MDNVDTNKVGNSNNHKILVIGALILMVGILGGMYLNKTTSTGKDAAGAAVAKSSD